MDLLKFALHIVFGHVTMEVYLVPPVFQNCTDIFRPGKDEKYANCTIGEHDDPCDLLQELHKAKEFRTYFLAIFPIILSIITCILNITYLIVQILCYLRERSNFRKRHCFLISRSVSIIFANLLFYVVIIVWKSSGFQYTSAMIFILVGSINFLSVTGTYIVLTILLYTAIKHQLWYKSKLQVKHCYFAIGLIWTFSVAISVCIGLWGATLFYPESAPISCSFNSCQRPLAILIVVGLSLCYSTVLLLYALMMFRLQTLMRKSSMIKTKSTTTSVTALRRLGFNMLTFAVGSVPILVVCIVALVNLEELSMLGEGDKSPCKTYLYSHLFVEVEVLASIAAIVWLLTMIADPIINYLADEKLRRMFNLAVTKIRRRFQTTLHRAQTPEVEESQESSE